MKPKLKIGNITSLEQARTAASLGPDYIGLKVSAMQQDAISPIQLPEIINWIPDCLHVAEVTGYSAESLENLGELLGLGHFQTSDHLNLNPDSDLILFRETKQGDDISEKETVVCDYAYYLEVDDDQKSRCMVTINPGASVDIVETVANNAYGFNVPFSEETSFDEWENLLLKLGR